MKKRVRARMERTGEKYTEALRALQGGKPEAPKGGSVDFDGTVHAPGSDELPRLRGPSRGAP